MLLGEKKNEALGRNIESMRTTLVKLNSAPNHGRSLVIPRCGFSTNRIFQTLDLQPFFVPQISFQFAPERRVTLLQSFLKTK